MGDKNPNTHKAVIKALIRASMWLDAENNKNRNEGVEMLSQKQYVGADYEVLANSMNGTFEYEKGDKRDLPDFNVFFRHNGSYPYYSDAVWSLTQMRRWGKSTNTNPTTGTWKPPKKCIARIFTWRRPRLWLPKARRKPAIFRPTTKPASSRQRRFYRRHQLRRHQAQ